jgi:hypothetical protein
MGKKSREKKERQGSITEAVAPVIRQAFQPKELRLGSPRRPTLQDIKALGDSFAARAHITQAKTATVQELLPQDAWRPFLANLGTGLWRLRQRMLDPSTGQPLEEMRRAYRHFESVWDVLADAGIQIRDHKGEFLPERGFSGLHVAAYQPTPGLKKERVIDTIKPTILIKRAEANQDVLIQIGEVIVGTPEDAGGSHSKAEGSHPKGA